MLLKNQRISIKFVKQLVNGFVIAEV